MGKKKTKKGGPYDGMNYETHAVFTWVDNDEPLYRKRMRLAQENYEQSAMDEDNGATEFAQVLKNWVEGMAPDLGGVWGDLLQGALSEVDWYELAETWMEEYAESLPKGRQ